MLILFPVLTVEARKTSKMVKETVANTVAVNSFGVIVFRFIILAPFRFCPVTF